MLEREFAAPAPGAGVEHHQGRRCGQDVMPLLELQQSLHQLVLREGVQVIILRVGDQCLRLAHQLNKGIRVIPQPWHSR